MESIVNSLVAVLKNNTFEFGITGVILAVLLLVGLIYLFINRNQVMTISYGMMLLGMVIFLVLCIVTLFLISIYGITR